jgi:hypothetical protein
VLAYLQLPSGPLPGAVVGGLAFLGVGKMAWLVVDLAPGKYVSVCTLLDIASGKSHAEQGMIAAFTIQRDVFGTIIVHTHFGELWQRIDWIRCTFWNSAQPAFFMLSIDEGK